MFAAIIALVASIAGSMTAGSLAASGGFWLGSAAIEVSVLGASIIGGVVALGVSYAGSALLGLDTTMDQPQLSDFDRGILINKASNNAAIPVVYGSRRVGGTRVLIEVSGTNNEYLNIVLALCEGEISAINTVYFNDVDSTDSRFTGLVDIYKHTGSDSQVADAALVAEVAAWTTAHQLCGVAYLYVRLKYDRDAFPAGLPVITADVDGKLVYDPRDATTKFSSNPALCARDYLVNTRYGRSIPAAMIDDTALNTAADYCDESVTVGGVTQARYTCDGVVDTSQSSLEIVSKLLTSCRGMLVFTGGLYKLVIDKPEAATFDFTESNITGAWSISMGSKRNTYNRMRANFFNPSRSWQPDIAVVDSTTLRTADNGLLLERTIDLPFTADVNTARQIATINLNQSRQQLACEFTAMQSAELCEVGDVVTVTHSTPGWSSKKFRVLGIGLSGKDEVRISALEYDVTVYDFGTIATVDATPNTTLPDPYNTLQPVANAAIAEETYNHRLRSFTRLLITFDKPALFEAWFDHVEVWWSEDNITYRHLFDTDDDFHLDPVEEGSTHYIRLKTVSIFGRKTADADDVRLVKTVIGYGEIPASLTELQAVVSENTVNLYSSRVTDPDVELYEFRLGDSWSGAVFLAGTKSPNLSLSGVKPGGHTFYANTLSNNGQYGTTPRARYAYLVGPPDGWAVQAIESCDYNGVGTHDNTEYTLEYSGEPYLKCSHTAGVLTGTYTSPIYDRGASARYLVYLGAGVVVTGVGNTWDDQVPAPTTWDEVAASTRSWRQIFEHPEAPSASISLYYGNTSPPASVVERQEILSAIVTGQYYQVVITITDPAPEINALVESFSLTFCQ